MSELPILSVKDLRKQFLIGSQAVGSVKNLLLWWRRRTVQRLDVLKGVSFDLMPGQCVAIIGRNGAGKSTLLSLIANIYKPTSGSVTVRGRVAPLLELGAGFHPDLTGIENVFFNGVVLGLTRNEIKARLDEIVAFSELGSHIHAPVRTYSSGMLARLGFAIAVHVDADLLLVDEVLAVGDFEFMEKCLARIRKFRADGGSILLVSHQMETIKTFADHCVWIQHGEVVMQGSPNEVIPAYRSKSESDLAAARSAQAKKSAPADSPAGSQTV